MESDCGHLKYVYKEYRYLYLTYTGGGEDIIFKLYEPPHSHPVFCIKHGCLYKMILQQFYFKKYRLNNIIHLLTNRGVLVPFVAGGVYLWFV